jgi:molybdopterin synthase sulfur carrier subunit
VIQVVLPAPLLRISKSESLVELEVPAPVTQRAVLDALEDRYPVLVGTMRDRNTKQRRAYVRFYGDGKDLSEDAPDALLPAAVAEGREPFLIVGAMSGG